METFSFFHHINLTTSASIVNSVFQNSESSSSGGAIFFQAKTCSLRCVGCFFIENTSADRGGGICVKDGQIIELFRCCFLQNQALFSSGFILWSYEYSIDEGYVNCTSEISKPSWHSSGFGGSTKSLNNEYNNSDYFPTDTPSLSAFLFLSDANIHQINYFQLNNATHSSLLRFYAAKQGNIYRMNVISAKISYYFIEDHDDNSNNICFTELIIVRSTISQFTPTTRDIFTFNECFSDSNIGTSSIIQTQNLEIIPMNIDYCNNKHRITIIEKRKLSKTISIFTFVLFTNQRK